MPKLPPPPPVLITGAQVWLEGHGGPAPRAGQAVLIEGARIGAVGPEAELRRRHPGARVVALPGGTLLPGLIEGHAHVGGMGALRQQVVLSPATSVADALRRIRAWTQDHPEGWILGRGWDQNRWPSKAFPLASDLDAAIGDRPAYLRRVDGHAAWVNTEALRLAGITRATPDPAGGQIIRDVQGEPTGVLVDAAMDLVSKHIPAPSADQVETRLLAGLQELRAFGFTAVADMGIPAAELSAYRRLAERGALPIRVFAYLSHDAALLKAELARPRARELSFFQVQGMKFYLDGALGSRGARLLEPYADAPGQSGLWVTEPSAVRRDVAAVAKAGYQPAVHAIGDAANRAALDALRGLPRGPLPPRVEHAQIVTAQDAARFGRQGVIASVQPVHCTSDHAWTPDRLGPARTPEAFPWRRFLQGGATLALGSDAPIEDANPYISLAAAETRQDPEGRPAGGFLPDQRLTRTEALRGYTVGNADALGRRDLGRLAPGAAADLLWVQAPILALTPGALRQVKPGRLWVNGLEVGLGR